MKRIYRLAGAMIIATSLSIHINAQTISYGDASGKQGQDGTYMGYYSGHHTTGTNNTFIGAASGMSNTGGSQNTALGSRSAYDNTNGSDNTFIGHFSGKGNLNGSWNTFIGSKTGSQNHDGLRNTFLGFEAGYTNYWGNDNLFAGHRSGFFNLNGNNNVFLGNGAGEYNKSGHYNVFLGHRAGNSNLAGLANTFLGYQASGSANVTYATAIGAAAKVTRDHSIVLGTVFDNVGIGTTAPAYQLQLSTYMAAKAGTSTWIVASDQRLKKDVSDYKDGLNVLKQIKPVWFSYNGQAGMPTDKKFVGIIAQDMQKIAPYTVGTFIYQDSLGKKAEYLDYDANAITYMLINSVKEQQEIIEKKDTEIKELSQRLEKLESLFASGTVRPDIRETPSETDFHKAGEENSNGAMLEQNAPNGFSQSTSIKYFIPQTVQTAVIDIYTVAGVKVASYPIEERGEGVLNLSASKFNSGVHVYDLVTDGKSNGARKMLVK